MPYIKLERRLELDPILQELWDKLSEPTTEVNHGDTIPKTLDQIKGEVNYCFTKILHTLLRQYGTRYHNLSNIHAITVDVAAEFERQFMQPYEDVKKQQNGEVLPLEI